MSCVRLDHTSLVVAQFAATIVLLAGGWWLWRGLAKARAFLACLSLTLLLGLVIATLWLSFTPPQPSEAAGGFYPHVYLLFLGALLGIAMFGRLLAHIKFSGFKADKAFRDGMIAEDLLRNERTAPDVSDLRLLSALINGVSEPARCAKP